ncbi:hypothetical protein, partial [Actinorugispora endophytica]|uniref:hypothetical protein n=1 Tax=Actinorugispora endophytica TaxID=1605990 RepID=UPI001AADFA96
MSSEAVSSSSGLESGRDSEVSCEKGLLSPESKDGGSLAAGADDGAGALSVRSSLLVSGPLSVLLSESFPFLVLSVSVLGGVRSRLMVRGVVSETESVSVSKT